jgi:hypothetical protein
MSKVSMVSDLWYFLRKNKKWWLLPIVIMLLGMGALMLFAGGSVLAPFIYTIF